MLVYRSCISILISILSLMNTVPGYGGNVKDYGAAGDGITDDTEAIRRAIKNDEDGLLLFPRGQYRITSALEIVLSEVGALGISGAGGSATILMEGPGPAIRIVGSHDGTSNPSSVADRVWERERMPIVEGIEIVGNHPDARGIELHNTWKPILRSVLIREVRYGVHLTGRNRNVLIDGCHIYHCLEIGIFLDAVNIHQMNISNSHISYNTRSGIKIQESEIRNLQITGNDIEYNYSEDSLVCADVWVDVTDGRSSVREGTLVGNTIQSIPSPEGYNVFFEGNDSNHNKIGLWSITGNHISNQTTNVRLKSVRGITFTGNTLIRGYDHHLKVENSQNLVISNNVFDHNEDYFTGDQTIFGGILISNCENVICSGLILDRVDRSEAIKVEGSRRIDISNCQIVNNK